MSGAAEAVLASNLRSVAESEDWSFVRLVRLAGLDPKRDFRYADLSGTDLRGQDLRSFDLTGANLEGALILGAKLPSHVTRRQRRAAINTGRSMIVMVGERLLSDEPHITKDLAAEMYVPRSVNEALRKSQADTRRRTEMTGAYIGDNSDLVRRRLSYAFRTSPLPRHGVAFVLAEPETDFDFDALLAIESKFSREKIPVFVFLLPHSMAIEESGELIVKARAQGLDQFNIMKFLPEIQRRRGQAVNPAQILKQADADRSTVLGFLRAMATFAEGVMIQGQYRGSNAGGGAMLVRGIRRTKESMAAAIRRAFDLESANLDLGRLRRMILVRSDVFDPHSAPRMAWEFRPLAGLCQVGRFTPSGNDDPEFYVVNAPVSSSIWRGFDTLSVTPTLG